MTIRTNQFPIPELIVPRHVLASTYDKTGLDVLVNGILEVNPEAIFYSTGGTGKAIEGILGTARKGNYVSVETFTGLPEMEGGLVKTLHPKVHAGLLAERGNTKHEDYLRKEMRKFGTGEGVYFDVLACNLYPFEKIVAQQGVTPETARVNIDIGGPAMIRGAAKNWHSVTVFSDPRQYEGFVRLLKTQRGVPIQARFELALQAFGKTAVYDNGIADYLDGIDFERDVRPGLNIGGRL